MITLIIILSLLAIGAAILWKTSQDFMVAWEAFFGLKNWRSFKHAVEVTIGVLARARWIANEENELGFRIFGLNFWYYKWPDPKPFFGGGWRVIEKREFGEVISKKIE